MLSRFDVSASRWPWFVNVEVTTAAREDIDEYLHCIPEILVSIMWSSRVRLTLNRRTRIL